MKNFNQWKTFIILLVLGLLSVICIFPYILSIQGELLKSIGKPIEYIFFVQFIQSAILLSATIFLGLVISKKINFHLPLIKAISEKGNYKNVIKNIVGKSIIIGALIAIAIYTVDGLFTVFGAGISTHQSYAPVWQKLLAAFYGGIVEEILMRLFLMTLFIWIGMKLFKQKQPSKVGIIIPIFLAAIIFGLGHLPITASLTTITPLVVVRAIVLNGIGGVVFGWLFWKRGLESAIIAHFTTDIFLLTLLPLLFK